MLEEILKINYIILLILFVQYIIMTYNRLKINFLILILYKQNSPNYKNVAYKFKDCSI